MLLVSVFLFTAVFALQFPAKKLDQRLLGLGAERIIEKGLGDDQHPSGYAFNIILFLFAVVFIFICELWRNQMTCFFPTAPFVGRSKAIPQSYQGIVLLLYTRYKGALDPWLLSLWKYLNQTNPSLLPRISDAIHPNLNILGDAKVEVIYYSATQDITISGRRSQFAIVYQ